MGVVSYVGRDGLHPPLWAMQNVAPCSADAACRSSARRIAPCAHAAALRFGSADWRVKGSAPMYSEGVHFVCQGCGFAL